MEFCRHFVQKGVRAARADRLLLESRMSVAQFAGVLQFPEEKNFARFFRREKGLSPLEYCNRAGDL